MNRVRLFAFLLVVSSLGYGASSARAAWPSAPLVNVPVCTASGEQVLTALVRDGLGGLIAVWQDSRNGADGIFAQRLDASGVAQWAPNGIAVVTANSASSYPAAIPDGRGGAIIAWVDRRADPDGDIYAQRIDASGATQWDTGGVPVCTAAGFGQYANLVSDGAGGAIVVWMDSRAGQPVTSYAQRLSAGGIPQWAPGGVPFAVSANAWYTPSAVAKDDSGGVIAAWHDLAPSGTAAVHTWAQRLDGTGQPRWGANGIMLADTISEVDPAIAEDGAGGAIIVWADYRGGTGTTSTYGQRVSAAGTLLWGANGVPLAPPAGFTRNDAFHAAVPDGAGGAVVVWSDDDSKAIRAQRVNGFGATQWPFDGVLVCSTTGERQPNRIQSDGAGGVLVPWSDDRADGGDVYVQRINAAGEPAWTTDGVATCTARYLQVMPMLVPDGAGGALVAWSDYRSGAGWHVFAQNVASAGTPGGTTLGVGAAPGLTGLAVRCAGPNPSRGAFVVECSLPKDGDAVVSLFDVTGRCLESRSLAGLGAGRHRITFAGALEARSPGVYLIRLSQDGHHSAARMVVVR